MPAGGRRAFRKACTAWRHPNLPAVSAGVSSREETSSSTSHAKVWPIPQAKAKPPDPYDAMIVTMNRITFIIIIFFFVHRHRHDMFTLKAQPSSMVILTTTTTTTTITTTTTSSGTFWAFSIAANRLSISSR